MRMKIIMLFAIGLFALPLLGQKSYGIIGTQGFVFWDYFGKEPGNTRIFQAYGTQTDLSVWIHDQIVDHTLEYELHLGYTNFVVLYHEFGFFPNYSNTKGYFSYLSFKSGLLYSPLGKKLSFTAFWSQYVLLERKDHRSQNRWFSTLDFGLKYQINSRFGLQLSSPVFTLYPPYDGKKISKPLHYEFDPFFEITGANLGLSYRIK